MDQGIFWVSVILELYFGKNFFRKFVPWSMFPLSQNRFYQKWKGKNHCLLNGPMEGEGPQHTHIHPSTSTYIQICIHIHIHPHIHTHAHLSSQKNQTGSLSRIFRGDKHKSKRTHSGDEQRVTNPMFTVKAKTGGEGANVSLVCDVSNGGGNEKNKAHPDPHTDDHVDVDERCVSRQDTTQYTHTHIHITAHITIHITTQRT